VLVAAAGSAPMASSGSLSQQFQSRPPDADDGEQGDGQPSASLVLEDEQVRRRHAAGASRLCVCTDC
jgi:hypothetical protein